jgi:hypothetical protein
LHAENFGDLHLCHAAVLEDRVDLQRELRFEQLLLRIGKTKVREDVSAAFGYAGNAILSFSRFGFHFSLIVPLGFHKPLLNQINLPCRCGDTLCGLLLKHVQNIDGILKTDRVDAPPRISVMRSHNFQHAGTAEAFEGLGGRSVLPSWAAKSACPMSILTSRGKDRKSLSDVPIHLTGFNPLAIAIPLYICTYTSASVNRRFGYHRLIVSSPS